MPRFTQATSQSQGRRVRSTPITASARPPKKERIALGHLDTNAIVDPEEAIEEGDHMGETSTKSGEGSKRPKKKIPSHQRPTRGESSTEVISEGSLRCNAGRARKETMSRALMDALPPEIGTLICLELDEVDIPKLRLVSRFWNNIASPYLLHRPTLIFKQDSFNRLIDISKHPFFKTLVTALDYIPNTLKDLDRRDWEDQRVVMYFKDNISLPLVPDPSEKDLRAFRRAYRKAQIEQDPYSQEELGKAWSLYKKFYAEQEALRGRDYGTAELCEAISNFPNLRKVSMNHGWELWPRPGHPSDEKHNPYARAQVCAGSDDTEEEASGVPQLRSLLEAVDNAGTKLQSLRIGSVDWKFLTMRFTVVTTMMRVMAPIKRFELRISTGYDDEEQELGLEIDECRDCIDNSNALPAILSAASQLEDLTVAFDCSEPFAPAEFGSFVQSTTWCFLHTLTIECIETSKEVWLEFLGRHCSTLRHLVLSSIELSRGHWADVLETMQQMLELRSAYFGYRLTGIDPQQLWNLEPDIWAESWDMCSNGNRTRKALGDFFVSGGLCPLRDEDAHPNWATR